jgi:ATP-dependent Clp protease ATP-binding subunit ClpA
MNTDLLWKIIIAAVLIAAFAYSYMKSKKGSDDSRKKAPKSKFTTDMTELAEQGKLDPFSGREEEIDRTIHIVMRRSKNNPLLIGQPGVGKTAIVEGLAARIVSKDVPPALYDKRVLSLDISALVSETKYRGELEARLKGLIQQLEGLQGRAILFIDEIHMLQQIGQSEGSLNISDILKPALARGDVQIIGATTWMEYEKYIQPDQALDRRFQPVLVDEPSPEEAIAILRHLRPTYEEFHNVSITDAAIEAAVHLSDEQIKDRYLPDKAIDLIDEASAKVSIEASMNSKVAMGLIHAASKEKKEKVDAEDIKEVADQWVIHSKEDAKRDARKE